MDKSAIIKYWDNVRDLTIQVLELFPAEQMDFRPTSKVRKVAEQFDHILTVELHVRNGFMSNNWEPTPGPVLKQFDKSLLANMLRSEHEKTDLVLRALLPEAFTRLYNTSYGKISGEGFIYLTIDEEIHHRGNLYVYLRLLNIVPPEMVQNYGELFMED
jgi:uncharacterized damage-inducible protein DinB